MFSAASSVPREGEAQRTKRSIRSCFSAISSASRSSCRRSCASACCSSGSLRSKRARRSALIDVNETRSPTSPPRECETMLTRALRGSAPSRSMALSIGLSLNVRCSKA